MSRRTLPPRQYHLSDLPDAMGVASVPDNARTVHTLFAILLDDVDRSDMGQDVKPAVIEGLIQAWTYFANESGLFDAGEDVLVEYFPGGLDTTIVEPCDDFPPEVPDDE